MDQLFVSPLVATYIHTVLFIYAYILHISFRLHNAQDQLVHLKHEEDELNRLLNEDEAQIKKITKLIDVVEA